MRLSTLSSSLIFFAFLLVQNSVFSQNKIWYFGWAGAGATSSTIDFTGGVGVSGPSVTPVAFYESITMQSNAANLVQFYSNGIYVRDRNHGIMPNGAGLNGPKGTADGSSPQGAISFPFPGSATKYVLVTTGSEDMTITNGIRWSEIDMTLAGNGTIGSPLGDITANKDIKLTGAASTTEMLGLYSVSCNEFWVVGHEFGNDRFVAIKFTAAGPLAPVYSNAGPSIDINSGARGSIRISPDGTKLAMTGGTIGAGHSNYIFSFNSTTGAVSAGAQIPAPPSGKVIGYGLEWSPNSRYVYIGAYSPFQGIFVYDSNTNTTSDITLAGSIGDLQIGPDDKIYVGQVIPGTASVGTITNPDLGPASTYAAAGLAVAGAYYGLPQGYSCSSVVCPDTSLNNSPAVVCSSGGTIDLSALLTAGTAAGTWSIPAAGRPGGAGDLATLSGVNNATFNINNTVGGTYTVRHTLTAPGGGACGAFAERTVTIQRPTVTFTIPDDTMCISEGAIALSGGSPAVVAPATGLYSGAGVTLGTTFTPSTLGVGNSTITYTYTDADGCPNTATDILYVLDTPTVTFVIPDDTMCISEPALALTGGLPAAVLPATGVYTGAGATGGTTFTPSTLGVGNSTITYTYTDALGCSNARTDIMYVLDTPTVTFVIPDDTMCISEPALALTGGLPAAVAPATGVYSGAGVTLGTTFTPSTLGVGNSTITYTYTDALGCSNARTDIMYVLDTPTVTFVIPDDTMCISEPALALTGGLPAAVAPATGVYSGAGVTLGTTFTPSTLGVGNSTITYTYTDALGCSNARTDIMYVLDTPTVTFVIPDDTMCISEPALALTGGLPAAVLPATGVYTGAGVTGGTTFTPSTLGVGNSTITYTYTDALGCSNARTDIMYVLDTPTVTFVIPDDTMCISEPALALIGGLPAAVAPATGVYSGAGVTLGTTFTPSTLGVGNSTITYTYTDALGCSNARTDIMYVLDTPTVTFVIPDDTMCISEPALALTGGLPAAVAPATGVYSGAGVTLGTTFTPSTLGVGNSTITYTYTDALGCSNARTDILYVLDTPTVTFVIPDDTMCISEPALALTGGLPAAVLPATGVYTGVGVTGGTTFTPSTLGVGNSTITYTYTDALGCSNARTDIMYVLDTPTVTFVIPDDTMCISEPALALTGGLPAAVLPATGVYTGVGVTLGTTFTPSTLGVGNSTITYTYTDALGCSNARTDIMYVLDTPTVTFVIPDDTMCISEPALALTGGLPAAVLPATGVYSGAGVTLGTTFTPSTLGVGNSTITYTYTDALGCSNARTDIMYVLDTPTVTFVIPDDTMCISEPALALTGGLPAAVLPATGVYSGAGVTLGTTFTPSTLGVGNSTITYTYTDASGCSNTATDIMYVLGLPVVSLTLGTDEACEDAGALALTGGSPAAVLPATGVYSGTGISTSPSFSPSVATAGPHTITYTYTDIYGCVNTATDVFTVNALPVITFNAMSPKCIDDALFLLASATPIGGTYTGIGVVGGISYDPAVATVGSHLITYSYTDAKNCTNSATETQVVNGLPVVDLGADLNVCEGEPESFTVPNYPTILWYNGANGTSISVDTTQKVYVNVTDVNGCMNSDTALTFLVPKATIASLREDTTICEKAMDVVLLEVANTGVTINWQDGSTGSQYSAIYPGEYIATITDINGCMASDTVYLKDSCSMIGLTMPNIFTPNTNGINDYFYPVELEFADKDFIIANIQYIRFQVYDRWGILVHASEGVLPRWDGKSVNGNLCSDGTYFWKLEFSDAAGNENNRNGFVKLYRPER